MAASFIAAASMIATALAVARRHLFVGAADGLEAFPARCTGVCPPTWKDTGAPGAKILVAHGVVYAASGTTALADSTDTGGRLWDATLPGSCASGPTVANGVLYFASTFANELVAFARP